MCTENVLENQEEKLLFPYCDRLQHATFEFAEDRDQIARTPRHHRFTERAAHVICGRATAIVIVPYEPRGRRWLGRGVADERHQAVFRALDRCGMHLLLVRTMSDRVAYWLTTAAEHRAPGASVYVLDRTGAHFITPWGVAA